MQPDCSPAQVSQMTGTILLLAKLDKARLRQHTERLGASKVICVRDEGCYEPLAITATRTIFSPLSQNSFRVTRATPGEKVTPPLACVNRCETKGS